jgi:hypothetical protein
MRCGIVRVIAQGQTKDKTSIRPGLLFPISEDARIRLLCSYKSRRAPSMVLGITPRAEDFVCVVREEPVRVLVAHTLHGERAHTGTMIHVTTLDHTVSENAIMPFRSVLLILAPMRVIRPLEDRFVSFFLGTEGPTFVTFCKLWPALHRSPWFGLRFSHRLGSNRHSRHDLGFLRHWFLRVRGTTKRYSRRFRILHGNDAVLIIRWSARVVGGRRGIIHGGRLVGAFTFLVVCDHPIAGFSGHGRLDNDHGTNAGAVLLVLLLFLA